MWSDQNSEQTFLSSSPFPFLALILLHTTTQGSRGCRVSQNMAVLGKQLPQKVPSSCLARLAFGCHASFFLLLFPPSALASPWLAACPVEGGGKKPWSPPKS